MKILMLGWEYPPHISGGLGTACQGLTVGLSKLHVDINFVVPHLFGKEEAPHMHLSDAGQISRLSHSASLKVTASQQGGGLDSQLLQEVKKEQTEKSVSIIKKLPITQTIQIPSHLMPYYTPQSFTNFLTYLEKINSDTPVYSHASEFSEKSLPANIFTLIEQSVPDDRLGSTPYGADLFSEVGRFARNVLDWAEGKTFDLIHAHDWMTYPAGIALSKLTGIPLVIHVHSLEYDRSGKHVNQRIDEIERTATWAADSIIAVSYYTRSVLHDQHRIPFEKISVVHNGVYSREVVQSYRGEKNQDSKIILFLGRITFQKGPDYFVEAASRVIPHCPEVTFVMAGSGDMLPQLVNRVLELQLSKNFIFTGFLKGEEVERMYSIADLYIMPSVSEPFGISTLEAISHDIPVIISRQSGVSEVLNNALKVDFWDVDRLANLMIGVMRYPEIKSDIVGMAKEEVRRLHWDAAAKKVMRTYRQVLRTVTN